MQFSTCKHYLVQCLIVCKKFSHLFYVLILPHVTHGHGRHMLSTHTHTHTHTHTPHYTVLSTNLECTLGHLCWILLDQGYMHTHTCTYS